MSQGQGWPKVSCLMVTSGDPARLAFFARSVQSYTRQTYPDRELVIVSDCGPEDRAALAAFTEGLGREDVSCVWREGRHTLGSLRNASVGAATGGIVCQWDDDDLYHPERVARQAAPLLSGRGEASLLGGHFSYFQAQRRLMALDWTTGLVQGHAGTLMWRRDLGLAYPEEGRSSGKGEDASLFHQLLRRHVRISLVDDAPYLFVYRCHGANSWEAAHHEGLAARYGMPRAALLADAERLQAALRAVFLEEDEVRVDGPDGFALTVRLAPCPAPGP